MEAQRFHEIAAQGCQDIVFLWNEGQDGESQKLPGVVRLRPASAAALLRRGFGETDLRLRKTRFGTWPAEPA